MGARGKTERREKGEGHQEAGSRGKRSRSEMEQEKEGSEKGEHEDGVAADWGEGRGSIRRGGGTEGWGAWGRKQGESKGWQHGERPRGGERWKGEQKGMGQV